MDGLNRRMRRLEKSKKLRKQYSGFENLANNRQNLHNGFSDALDFEIGNQSHYIKGLSKRASNQSRKK